MDGCDSAQFISKLLQEILHLKNEIPIIAVTDSNALFSTTSTTKLLTDRRLRVEVSAIRQLMESKIGLAWVDSIRQLADVLKKKGAPSQNMMRTVQTGVIHPKNAMNERRSCGNRVNVGSQ